MSDPYSKNWNDEAFAALVSARLRGKRWLAQPPSRFRFNRKWCSPFWGEPITNPIELAQGHPIPARLMPTYPEWTPPRKLDGIDAPVADHIRWDRMPAALRERLSKTMGIKP